MTLFHSLTIDVTEVERSLGTNNEEDEDYELSFDITLRYYLYRDYLMLLFQHNCLGFRAIAL